MCKCVCQHVQVCSQSTAGQTRVSSASLSARLSARLSVRLAVCLYKLEPFDWLICCESSFAHDENDAQFGYLLLIGVKAGNKSRLIATTNIN